MNKYTFYLLFILNASIGVSQSLDSFRLDFNRALTSEFSTTNFDMMIERYENLLSNYTYGYQRGDTSLQWEIQFPLRAFRQDSLYYSNIQSMLQSDSESRRKLAFLVIGATGDSSMTKELLRKMRNEQNAPLLYSGAMSLYLLGCEETTPIFDLLVKHEHLGDYFLPAYLRLNKDSLLQTALSRIESNNSRARIFAAYSLGFIPKTRASEKALRRAVQKWDIKEKGYAIFSLKQLQSGNLLSLLKPLLNHPLTKNIVLESLLGSPTTKDNQYLKSLAKNEKPTSVDLLTCFYKSSKVADVKYWLYLLRTKRLSDQYFHFGISDQPLLYTDEILPEILETLKKTKDLRVLKQLSRSLQGRNDTASVLVILELLHHSDAETRYWVAEWNKNCHSPILAEKIPALLSNPTFRTPPLVTMAIENDIDSLQILFEDIYINPSSTHWKYAALTYLAAFPKPSHRMIFRDLLKANNQHLGIGMSQKASLGLGRLGDIDSDELIITSSRFWREKSDSNAYYHLIALEMLKTEKAKSEIQSYQNSKEKKMSDIANQILSNW